jgi:hypothetical protein
MRGVWRGFRRVARGVLHSMAKRRRRSRRKRKRPSLILIVALLVLAAGFFTRRVLAPRAMYFLTHRSAAPAPVMAGEGRAVPPSVLPSNGGSNENLTDSDRRALDRVLRRRSGQ